MAVLNKIYPIFLPLALTGCYTDFNHDIDCEPVLCLNAVITAGEGVETEVSRTWLYTDSRLDRDDSVDDAVVTIYANGKEAASDYIPREGDRVRIKAVSAKYGEAEAEVTVPVSARIGTPEVSVTQVSTDRFDDAGYIISNATFNVTISIPIEDIRDTDNYFHYEWATFNKAKDPSMPWVDNWGALDFSPGNMQYDSEPLFSEHIDAFESVMGADAWGFTFFTDRQFANKSYTLKVRYHSARAYICATPEDLKELEDCGYTVSVSTISESMYNFANYCWQTDSGFTGDLGDTGLGDPVYAYSNVSTGAGIVYARSITSYDVSLRDYIIKALWGDSAE